MSINDLPVGRSVDETLRYIREVLVSFFIYFLFCNPSKNVLKNGCYAFQKNGLELFTTKLCPVIIKN